MEKLRMSSGASFEICQMFSLPWDSLMFITERVKKILVFLNRNLSILKICEALVNVTGFFTQSDFT